MPSSTAQNVPVYGLRVKLNHKYPEKWGQYVKVRWHQLGHLIMLGARYILYWIYIKIQGRTPLMDYLHVQEAKQIYGVPIGGIGAGTIGRGFRGEFCRYQLRPGIYNYETVPGNQFIVSVMNSDGDVLYQKVLSAAGQPKTLKAWDWSYNGADGEYVGLYPRSWTVFRIPEQNLVLTCRQISPIIPDNYLDSCLPCAAFVWSVVNNSSEEKTVSITFTFQNGIGEKGDRVGGCWSEGFTAGSALKATGQIIHHKIDDMGYAFAVAAADRNEGKISCLGSWNPMGRGDEVWDPLKKNGCFSSNDSKSSPTKKGQQLGVAVSSQKLVPAGGSADYEFSLAWDMPKINFGKAEKTYYRYYTRQFGREGHAAGELAATALEKYSKWEEAIDQWQNPILEDGSLPDWYKSALFNETYFVSDGGSVWLDLDESETQGLDPNDPRIAFGRFAYLEGHEYRMYNTYDVHFYASFALAKNWPKLQAVLQRDFGDTVLREDSSWQWHLFDGDICARKKKDSIPHDLGDPGEEPFLKINAYPIHDVSEWRDLNLKYVLQVYRDFSLTNDENELRVHWQNVLILMRSALRWDRDGDGLIENHGSADQTYDTWIMKGPSAYCGSLWLAALQVTCTMAGLIDPPARAEFDEILTRARSAFQTKLWNGKYYNFDCSNSQHSKTIMSDQLCGLWYLLCSSQPNQIIPDVHAVSALRTIYEFNVQKFNNGETGAVNGMTPEGLIETFTIQSEEMWAGVVYAYSALLLLHGMDEEAFRCAGGLYKLVYERIGLGFQTPEALYEKDCYRSIGYMRPLSIWSMQLALDLRKRGQ